MPAPLQTTRGIISPELVALDALVWTTTHTAATGAVRTAPIDAIDAMRDTIAGLRAGLFSAWDADVQTAAADELAGYLHVALDERAEMGR